MTSQSPRYYKGVAKQILSGDAVIIRGLKAKGGPPPESQLNFSNVTAPRLARRGPGSQSEIPDEPYAWASREFLRKKVIGQEIHFSVETKTATGREYGILYLGKETNKLQNVTDMMVLEGLLTVRRESIRGDSNLGRLEDEAKAAERGKWNTSDSNQHIRNITWTIANPKAFVDQANRQPIKAVIEHIRDGSTVRALLLPEYSYITLMFSGIRCPTVKLNSESRVDKANSEPFAEEAKYFVESRLLQREVQIILDTCNNNNFVGTVKHPNGNISELLLKEGLAKCIDWMMPKDSDEAEKLRAAEKMAKNKKLRLWHDFKPSAASKLSARDREFTGKVSEVINGDALIIRKSNGESKKVFLASIRSPRSKDSEDQTPPLPLGKNFRPLYDIPFLYEAREFLRKKLIGQKVQISVDYIQPPQNNFPEKLCCTVRIGDTNVAEALISQGLATVVKYRQDDDQRASCYNQLMEAEEKALKDGKGLHCKKEVRPLKVLDLSTDSTKSKNFLPFFQRAGRMDAIVDFVASGSRIRVFVPKDTYLVTFLLAGISCPKPTRPAPGGSGLITGEPHGREALELTKDLILQRDIQIEVDSMDKGCNFIGWLFYDNLNLSVQLVERGLATVHSTAEGTKFYNDLVAAEKNARKKSLNIWADYVELQKEEKIEEVKERRVDYKSVVITEVTREGHIFGQYCSDGPALINLMETLRQEFCAHPPVGGAYSPRKGDVCAAKFADGDWYRARVEKVQGGGQVSILYIDYGNREVTTTTKLARLSSQFANQPPYAHEMAIALVKMPKDEDNIDDAISALGEEVTGKELAVNLEYKLNGLDHVSLQRTDNKGDVAKTLLSQGLILLDSRKDSQLQGLLADYKSAQEEAKGKHLNIWVYGDVTEDDAFEFGMER